MHKSKETKVCILGDTGVGKSSIMLRFVSDDFTGKIPPTLDTAGQEKYQSLIPLYYRDASVAIIVYDLTNRASFDVLKKTVTELKENGPAKIVKALVGNKQDLIEQEQVKYEEAKIFAKVMYIYKEIGAIFKYTSAKEGKGIQDLFESICEELEKQDMNQDDEDEKIREQLLDQKKKKKKKFC